MKCTGCGKEFAKPQALGGHRAFCGKGGGNCEKCSKFFPSLQALNGHRGACGKKRPGPGGWNRGLTKTTDRRVAQGGETFIRRFREGAFELGGPLTEEHKRKISEACLRKSREGTWHNSFSAARSHKYKGAILYGKWELAYAQSLDEKGVPWIASLTLYH